MFEILSDWMPFNLIISFNMNFFILSPSWLCDTSLQGNLPAEESINSFTSALIK